MSFAFKRFNFFQPHQVPRHAFPPNASCVVPGGPVLWVGTESGSVFILDARLSLLGTFNAHGHRVLEVVWLEKRQLLITVGSEEPGCSSTTVKLWPAEKLLAAAAALADGGSGSGSGHGGAAGGGGATGAPPLAAAASGMNAAKVTKVFGSHSGQQYPEAAVTAAAAAEGAVSTAAAAAALAAGLGVGVDPAAAAGGAGGGMTALTVAIGLASGHVVVLTGEIGPPGGNIPKARLSHSRRLSARPDQGDHWSVTGLELTGTADLLSLFVVTESQTLSFHLQTNTKTVLDPQGSAAPRCCCLRPGGALLTVARAEGLYDYTADTRAGCTVFEGPKQRLAPFGRYLVVVTRDDNASTGGGSSSTPSLLAGGAGGSSSIPGGHGHGGGSSGSSSSNSSCLQLADVRTKLLAGTFVLQGLQHVFCAWGAVHAVTAAGAVWSYREIDLASQLEALLRRSLHKLALDVARAWGQGQQGQGQPPGGKGGPPQGGADAATLASIHQRWGDHLYSKGEYDAAMAQYLETVGLLEPSYVIRRFLDAQRIHNLTAYLELMHERGLATCDHTTLLLNCYTKLKDVSKLDAFIRRGGVDVEEGEELPAAPAADGSDKDGLAAAAAAAAGGGGADSGAGAGRRRARRYLSAAAAAAAEAPTPVPAQAAAAAAATSLPGSRSRLQLQSAAASGQHGQDHQLTGSASAAKPGSAAGPGGGQQGQQGQQPQGQQQAQLRFDADTAVRVLRGAGYAEHALLVADAAGQVDSVLDVLLDDLGAAGAEEAIAYLETLPRRRRAEALKKYGKALIGARAEDATRLIMDLCCSPPPTTADADAAGSSSSGPGGGGGWYLASVSDFAHLYSGEPTALMLLCEFILNTNSAAAAAAAAASHGGRGPADEDAAAAAAERAAAHERLLYHTLLELYLAEHLWAPPPEPLEQQQQQQQQPEAGREPQNGQEQQQQQLSEHGPPAGGTDGGAGGGAGAQGGRVHDMGQGAAAAAAAAAAAGTGAGSKDPGVEVRRAKALELLARGWPPHATAPALPYAGGGAAGGGVLSPAGGGGGTGSFTSAGAHGAAPHAVPPSYDPDHALVLCRLHGYRPGLLFLYDRLRLPREVLQVHMAAGDSAGLIEAVRKYGDAARGGDPVLWSEVLEYFVRQHDANPPHSDCSAQIMQVVEHVERSGVLPPLVVLQTLSRSRRLPLSLVRGYMARALQHDTAAVGRDKEAVTKLAAETAALREEVTRLRTQPRVFQAGRCSASGAPLELPAVHFLCGHSYNLRQLGDNERECPLCGPDQRRVAEIRRSMLASSLQPEKFFNELRESADGFSVVAEHFGRGLMNVTPALAAAAAAATAAGSAAAAAGGAGGGAGGGGGGM
ncbi:hypothetical protein HYH02_014378 [Chlamydomonas schloesseri]|uniref:Vacuolar protein sorting protein 11 C-terminal domain-containing protein n=1 Tax=Chlamydomonas schloesseri TaxID=2026947 RepID=A0A835VUN7_9CHLO|nr:hypothetical protein HYH02_014378 [Chlamydomonas schloesseri]|eukprot:KAG2428575.1 hypothetical protein HYH02_014378 [Chlamydomonas schloesseri]